MLLSRTLRLSTLNTINIGLVTSSLKLHTTVLVAGTHDYEVVKMSLPKEKLQLIESNSNIFKQVSRQTETVTRWVYTDGNVLVEDDSGQILIVGASKQVKKAMEMFQEIGEKDLDSTNETKSYQAKAKLIWHGYKRNFKGQYAPAKPRKKCIRCGGKMLSGNPCPLCQLQLRSEYNIHYTDTELLKQFICPYTWAILDPSITGLCRQQHREVTAAVQAARLHGLLPFTLPIPSKELKKHVPAGVPTDRKIKVKMH